MPQLTLYQGDARREYAEHPIEVARAALLAAAQIESEEWAAVIRRFASALPPRRILRTTDVEPR